MQDQFISHIFVVPKKEDFDQWEPKGLEQTLKHLHFKMEGAHLLKDLQKGDWMISIDLKDAYLPYSLEITPPFMLVRFSYKDGGGEGGVGGAYNWIRVISLVYTPPFPGYSSLH